MGVVEDMFCFEDLLFFSFVVFLPLLDVIATLVHKQSSFLSRCLELLFHSNLSLLLILNFMLISC